MKQNKLLDAIGKWLQTAILYLSILLCLLISLCYWLRPDTFTLITSFPVVFWILPALILIGLGWNRSNKHLSIIAILLWFLYLIIFAEEPRSMVRFLSYWKTSKGNGEILRIISLNCVGGSIEASKEVKQYDPDIVLLQESPRHKELEVLGKELFGDDAEIIDGLDASIIVRGKIKNTSIHQTIHMTQATIQLTSGTEIAVISIRLSPPIFCFNLFSPSCWKEHQEDRQLRRKEIEEITKQIEIIPKTVPIIIGGDFNMPAGDVPSRLLKPRLHDTFQEGGIGWCNTAINDIPVSRIDQIWVSEHFKVISLVAKKTINSDHRIVICDVLITN